MFKKEIATHCTSTAMCKEKKKKTFLNRIVLHFNSIQSHTTKIRPRLLLQYNWQMKDNQLHRSRKTLALNTTVKQQLKSTVKYSAEWLPNILRVKSTSATALCARKKKKRSLTENAVYCFLLQRCTHNSIHKTKIPPLLAQFRKGQPNEREAVRNSAWRKKERKFPD